MRIKPHISAILFLLAFASTALLGVDVNIPDASLEDGTDSPLSLFFHEKN